MVQIITVSPWLIAGSDDVTPDMCFANYHMSLILWLQEKITHIESSGGNKQVIRKGNSSYLHSSLLIEVLNGFTPIQEYLTDSCIIFIFCFIFVSESVSPLRIIKVSLYNIWKPNFKAKDYSNIWTFIHQRVVFLCFSVENCICYKLEWGQMKSDNIGKECSR